MSATHQQQDQTSSTMQAHHVDTNGRLLGLVRPAELVGYLRVSQSTLYRWTASEQFPAPIVRRKSCTLWRWADVYAWEEAQRAQGVAAS